MLNRLTIRTRILLGFIFVLLLGVGALLPQLLYTLDKQSEYHEQLYIDSLLTAFNKQVDNQLNQALNLAATVASQPSLQQHFAMRDREALTEELLPTFKYLKDNAGIEQMQFHLEPAISFLRLHDPSNYGDDLASFRHTVVETNRNKKEVAGLESGVAGLGIRGVVPVFWQGKHLGSVEMGLSMRQNFVDTFKANHHADLGILRPADGGFKPLITSWSETNMFSQDDLNKVMRGEQVVQRQQTNNKDFLALAAPLKDFSGNIIGAVAIYTDRTESVKAFNATTLQSTMVAVGILLVGVLVAWLLSRSITNPIHNLVNALRNIAEGEQDLRLRLPVAGNDELTQVASLFNTFIGKVEQTVLRVLDHLGVLGSRTEYSFRMTGEAQDVARAQQGRTEEVSTAMNEMSATATEIAQNAVSTAEATEQVEASSVDGSKAVHDGSQTMLSLADNVLQASASIQTLDEYSNNIGSILDVISGISEQTNLLALNAAIEAARAGEHGRGFAVVADEIRKMAENSAASVKEVKDTIETIKEKVEIINAKTDKILDISNHQAAATQEISSATQELTSNAGELEKLAEII